MHPMHNAGMKLSDYLTKQGITDAAFAEQIGMSQSQVSRLRRGKCSPSFATIRRVAKATNNKVRLADWFAVNVVEAA